MHPLELSALSLRLSLSLNRTKARQSERTKEPGYKPPTEATGRRVALEPVPVIHRENDRVREGATNKL